MRDQDRTEVEQERADRAIHEAVRRQVEEHRRLGLPIAVEREGRVVWLGPDEIEVTAPEGPSGLLMIPSEKAADARSVAAWIKLECPVLHSLLKPAGEPVPPAGLIAYLSPRSASETDVDGLDLLGKQHLRHAEGALHRINELAPPGWARVRKRIPTFREEDKLVQFLCEIAVCAAVGSVADPGSFELSPITQPPKNCDLKAAIHGTTFWGEIKRSADPGPAMGSAGRSRPRALSVRAHRESRDTEEPPTRSRAEDLRSRLDGTSDGRPKPGVPGQLQPGGVNVLFLFEDAWTPLPHVRSALFGDPYYFQEPRPGDPPTPEGLFALVRWRIVSACCWMAIVRGTARTQRLWTNPNAEVPLPGHVETVLTSL